MTVSPILADSNSADGAMTETLADAAGGAEIHSVIDALTRTCTRATRP
jgi:hypothetical protein